MVTKATVVPSWNFRCAGLMSTSGEAVSVGQEERLVRGSRVVGDPQHSTTGQGSYHRLSTSVTRHGSARLSWVRRGVGGHVDGHVGVVEKVVVEVLLDHVAAVAEGQMMKSVHAVISP